MVEIRSVPLISVVTIAYNAEKTIEHTVLSVLSQTFRDFELLIYDACSTDKTPHLLSQLVTRDSRIRLTIHPQRHPWIFSAREGLSAARGRYFAFLDGDDFVAHNYLETLLTAITERNDSPAMGRLLHCDLGGKYVGHHPSTCQSFSFAENKSRLLRLSKLLLTPDSHGPVNLIYALWPTELLRTIGLWEVDGAHKNSDVLFCLRSVSATPIMPVSSTWICRRIPSAVGEIDWPDDADAQGLCELREKSRVKITEWNFPFFLELWRFVSNDARNWLLTPLILLLILLRVVLAVIAKAWGFMNFILRRN